MTISWKSIALNLQSLAHRVAATFIETFFAMWVVTDQSTLKIALVGALAASVVPLKEFLVQGYLRSAGTQQKG